MNRGISLLYLAYVIIVRADSVESIRALLDRTKFNAGEGTEALARELLAIKHSLEEKAN